MKFLAPTLPDRPKDRSKDRSKDRPEEESSEKPWLTRGIEKNCVSRKFQ